MSAVKEDGNVSDWLGLKNAARNASGSNIIKTLSAFKQGFNEASAASRGFFSQLESGAKAGWASISMMGRLELGIAAVTTAYAIANKIQQDQIMRQQKAFDDSLSLATSSASEASSIYELYSSYKSAQEAEDGSFESKTALTAATNALTDALREQAGASYDAGEGLQKLTENELEKAKRDAEAAVVAAEQKLQGLAAREFTTENLLGFNKYISVIDEIAKSDADFASKFDFMDLISGKARESANAASLIYEAAIKMRNSLVEDGNTDTSFYKNLDDLISLLKPDIDDLTDAQGVLSDTTGLYNDVVAQTPGKMNEAGDSASNMGHKFKEASDNAVSALTSIANAQSLLNSQSTGKSISLEDFNAEGMKEFASALEYVNGTYQLNTDKVNELVKAKSQEQIQINETNKALAQAQYVKNANELERLRNQLDNTRASDYRFYEQVNSDIAALESQNDALLDEIDQYNLMTAALEEATGAYQAWLNSRNGPEKGDMFRDALTALEEINKTLNDPEYANYNLIGREDYKRDIDFVIPDSIDSDDEEAVRNYMASLDELFTYDAKGSIKGLNRDNFVLKAAEQGLVKILEDNKGWEIVDGKKMADFAEQLNLSESMVQSIFGMLEEMGDHFDWSDEADKTLGDMAVSAQVAADNIRELEGLDVNLDFLSIEDPEERIEKVQETIDELKNYKVDLPVDSSEVENANTILKYCLELKQELDKPAILRVKTSKLSPDVKKAVEKLQEAQEAIQDMETRTEIGLDTSDAKRKVEELREELANIDSDTLKLLEIDTTSVETLKQSLENLTVGDSGGVDVQARLNLDSSEVESYEAEDLDPSVTYRLNASEVYAFNPPNLYRYVFYKSVFGGGAGGASVNGTAHASGTANLSGDWSTKGGRALVGELGSEIVVDPNTGRWYTVGDQGAEFTDIPEGAIIFNHVQTKALLENGHVAGRGRSYASGTAFISGGGGPIGGGGSGSKYPGYRPPSSSGGHSSGGKGNDLEAFDWIEIAIDRIERAIDKLARTAESAFKSLTSKLKASRDEITMITDEIELQGKAYDRYLEAAEEVKLSDDLKELVRDGAIDIAKYDDDTQDLISEYQDLYEKALDCSDAIDELHENLAELYKERFDNIQEDFENQLEMITKDSDAYDRKIEMLETKGYLQNADYYKKMQDIERGNIGVLNNELSALQSAFDEAMKSGEIEEGSDAWYEMKLSIEDVKAAIEESEIAIADYDNTIRQISWDYFDYAQERISKITDEAEFLLNLLDGEDMYDEKGILTDSGAATAGLHAQNYSVYMAQADKYAEEIKRINAELANDPNNTKLLERRDELMESQRDAILSAKSEKEALVELTEEGIEVALDAMQKLIDAYNESLDSQKDLYDYQKKISEQTKKISDLEKQLAAYQNNMSEEARSKIQKIQVDLKEARDDLKESEYDKFIDDTKKMLDELYTEYEEALNDTIDDAFDRWIDFVNDNAVDIDEYIEKQADAVGYAISEATKSIWEDGGGINGVVSEYGDDISDKLTSVGTTVESIFEVLEGIAKENGVAFAGKSYKFGGLIDYTGIAKVHGSVENPEMVLSSEDTKNFIMLRDMLRKIGDNSLLASGTSRVGGAIEQSVTKSTRFIGSNNTDGGYSVGSINVTIPIEHIENYNDFVNHLRNDRQFEQMIQSMTVGRLAGKSALDKNRYKW